MPPAATWVAADDPYGDAATILAEAGIEVAAWIVLTHSTLLGEANPDLAVVNCWGEPYPYALCAAAGGPQYAETLAAEAVRDTPTGTVILEACGQLGFGHGGHHEKTDGAYDADHPAAALDLLLHRLPRGLGRPRARRRATVATCAPRRCRARATVDATTLDTILASRHAAADNSATAVIAAVREAAPDTSRSPCTPSPIPGPPEPTRA